MLLLCSTTYGLKHLVLRGCCIFFRGTLEYLTLTLSGSFVILVDQVVLGWILDGLDRVSHRSRKTSRYADPSSSATTSCDLATKNLYFLIPFPRIVFDTGSTLPQVTFRF